MTEPFERLDEAMNRRRVQLRMNWREVSDAAGISYTALRAIRKGEYRPTELTARGLDDALQWTHGSVYAVLDGGDPTPIEDAERQASAEVQTNAGSPLLLSPHEALRRAVRATARELGVTPRGVDEVLQLVRRDLEHDEPAASVDVDARPRTDLSDLVRVRRAEAGLSLEAVAAETVDAGSGERLVEADWLDRLERAALDPSEYPEYPQIDALTDVLHLDAGLAQEAAGAQFMDIHTTWSEDGQVRSFGIGELSPEDQRKALRLMEMYRRSPKRNG